MRIIEFFTNVISDVDLVRTAVESLLSHDIAQTMSLTMSPQILTKRTALQAKNSVVQDNWSICDQLITAHVNSTGAVNI